MKASDLIATIKALSMLDEDRDPEVVVQTSGCCPHGHEIVGAEYRDDEDVDAITLRAG